MNTNKTEKAVIVASFFIFLLAGSLLANMVLSKQAEDTLVISHDIDLGSAFDTILDVTVTDKDGTVKATRQKVGDLVLTNFAYIIGGVFKNPAALGGSVEAITGVKQSTGSSVYPTLKSTTTTSGGIWGLYPTSYYRRTYLAVGTGTNTPSVSDYVLQTEVESKTMIAADGSYASGNVTFYGAVTMTASRTITEAGIYAYMYIGSGIYILLLRDTFAGISVVSTDTVTVSYTLMISAGFTNNFGTLLAAFFPRYATSTMTAQFQDTAGSSFTTNTIGDAVNNCLFDTNAAGPWACARIGTSSTAPSLSDYELVSPVESAVIAAEPITEASINFSVSSTIQVTADRTLYEAGFYTRGKDSSGSDRLIMLIRDTFDATLVSNGRQVTVIFKVYFNV